MPATDGPARLHNAYRVDKQGRDTYDEVLRGLRLLKKHRVEFNTLTAVNRAAARHPLEVYRFLRDVGSGFLQFIPLVERMPDADATKLGLDLALPPRVDEEDHRRLPVTDWRVEPKQYGEFLCAIFDEWVKRDVGKTFVQIFDVTPRQLDGRAAPRRPLRFQQKVRLGPGHGAQRGRLFLRPLCLSALQARGHPQPLTRRNGLLRISARLWTSQGGHPAALLPRVRGAPSLPRGVSQAPFPPRAGWRSGAELSLPCLQTLF